jgi:hypothetical protein
MSTIKVSCPCECTEVVTADLGDFNSTTATVEACATLRNDGIVSQTVPKSLAMRLEIGETDATKLQNTYRAVRSGSVRNPILVWLNDHIR